MCNKNRLAKTLYIITTLFLFVGCGGGGSSDGGSSDTTAPNFTTNSSVSVEENQINALTVHANDASTVTYSITGGNDRTKFSINSTSGLLTFKTAPDFETPTDSNKDNNYTLTVTATDTSSNQSQQQIIVSVTNLDEVEAIDSDFDYIPDDIEILLGSNPNNSDVNDNSIDDGLDTEGSYGDTFFDMQWHIHSLGSFVNDSGVMTIIGNDLDLLDIYHSYMGYNKGTPIIVQVVDTGVDADHEDLINNMDLTRSYDGNTIGDPSSNRSGDHGTKVAGIMAAEAFNGKGVRGIAPFAKIAGSNWLEAQGNAELETVWYSGQGAMDIAVSNNSWGSYFDTDTLYEDIMALGTSDLRNGKGRIYVFAAGNDRENNGNANLQYSINNRYMIAVAALKHDNTHASYSTPGSNILVSGYSGDFAANSPTIGTTTIMGTADNTGAGKDTWSDDVNLNYTYGMNGTSAASPTVAASIALVLEACPALTWRDVKYLVANHAKQVDSSNGSWVKNSADLWHSIDYGFGLINPKGMIEECSSSSPSYTNLSPEQNKTVTKNFNSPILDNDTIHPFVINMPDDMEIEWVEVTVDNNSSYASDYKVELSSPQGTRTTLMTERAQQADSWMDGGFRLSTAAMLGEASQGNWTIYIRDTWSDDSGTLKNIELKIYGH